MMLLDGKTALITGAGSGIGRAAAELFAREGAKVAVLDVDGAAADETVAGLPGDMAAAFPCDIADEASVAAAVEAVVAHYGVLDIAVNNAGVIGPPVRLAEVSTADWDRVIGINLRGTWFCMKHEIAQMLGRGAGVIVNTASTGGLSGAETQSCYNASKHGVIGLTKSAALEYAKEGIRINAVCPGPIDTPLSQDLFARAGEEAIASYTSMLRLGRFGRPEEVAEAIAWLASDRASLMIGATVVVDGGLLA